MERKKFYRVFILALSMVALAGFCGCGIGEAKEGEFLVWPDFVRYEDEYYLFAGTYAPKESLGHMLGQVKANGPRENSFYIPDNLEAAVLDVGTKLYELKGEQQQNAIIAAGGKNKIYRWIESEKFRHMVNGLSVNKYGKEREKQRGETKEG